MRAKKLVYRAITRRFGTQEGDGGVSGIPEDGASAP